MHRLSIVHRLMLSASLTLLCAALPAGAPAAGSSPQSSTRPAVSALSPGIAAGAVEDSLQACLARIPKDATAGQRLIAEQSCQRDEGDRKPVQATGGR